MAKTFLDPSDPETSIRSLMQALETLSFEDNFKGFSWEGAIPASTEVKIRNKIRDGSIPRGYLVTFAKGVNTIVAGDTEWDENYVYLKNFDGSTGATVKVFFFR